MPSGNQGIVLTGLSRSVDPSGGTYRRLQHPLTGIRYPSDAPRARVLRKPGGKLFLGLFGGSGGDSIGSSKSLQFGGRERPQWTERRGGMGVEAVGLTRGSGSCSFGMLSGNRALIAWRMRRLAPPWGTHQSTGLRSRRGVLPCAGRHGFHIAIESVEAALWSAGQASDAREDTGSNQIFWPAASCAMPEVQWKQY